MITFKLRKGQVKMKILRRIFILTFIALWLVPEANGLVSQERYSTFVDYLPDRGVDVAYRVTILGGPK